LLCARLVVSLSVREAEMTLNDAVLAIRENADDALVSEWANCRECEITDTGEIWFGDPQLRHGLKEDSKAEFVAWCQAQERCPTAYADEFFYDVDLPDWAKGSILVTKDSGERVDGEFGYECHELWRAGLVVGYVYDDGDGIRWSEVQAPEPYSLEERYFPLG
jgi:hypothetical protein